VGVSIIDASGRYVMFNSWWKDRLGIRMKKCGV